MFKILTDFISTLSIITLHKHSRYVHIVCLSFYTYATHFPGILNRAIHVQFLQYSRIFIVPDIDFQSQRHVHNLFNYPRHRSNASGRARLITTWIVVLSYRNDIAMQIVSLVHSWLEPATISNFILLRTIISLQLFRLVPDTLREFRSTYNQVDLEVNTQTLENL